MNLSGNPLDFLVAFAGGVLLSFTPCVYSLIPVSAGFITASSGGSKAKAFFLSFIYVTGIAVTYLILGLIASFTGSLFGRISSHPLTYIFSGILIIFFGISMLDIFAIQFPVSIKQPDVKKRGNLSAFVLGLVSGLIISPCLTPVLASILVYLATKKQLLYGAALLFVFAYGMGLILIIAGTFSSALASFPKSGKWMVYIKKACAAILIISGMFFIYSGIRRF
jgi:thiol:disulfide interchange protein DsbD